MADVEHGGTAFRDLEVDPREFLTRNDEAITFFECTREMDSYPNLDLLKWTANFPNIVGFFKLNGRWCITKGGGLPPGLIQLLPNAELKVHSNPIEKGENPEDTAIPSINSLFNSSLHEFNYIVSTLGLTQYYAPLNSREEFYRELHRFRPYFIGNNVNRDDYRRFLADQGAKYWTHHWDDLDDEKLRKLLGVREPGYIAFACAGCAEKGDPNGIYALHKIAPDGSVIQPVVWFQNEIQVIRGKAKGIIEESKSSTTCPECDSIGFACSLDELTERMPHLDETPDYWKNWVELFKRFRKTTPRITPDDLHLMRRYSIIPGYPALQSS